MLAVREIFQSDISRYFQSASSIILAKLMPLPIFRMYCRVLGFSYCAVRTDFRQQVATGVLTHLQSGKTPVHSVNLFWKTCLGIFDHYAEKMVNAYHPIPRLTRYLMRHTAIRNEQWLVDALRARKGIIMVSGHFGAVEYLPLMLALKGHESAMIMRFKTERLRRDCQSRCKQFNVRDIDASRPNVAFRALEAITQGKIMITLCDEFSHWKPHCECSILVFGTQIQQDRTLDVLYKRSKAPPACMGLVQRRKSDFILHIVPLTNGDESISLAKRSWEKMEQFILRYPQQWYQWQGIGTYMATLKPKNG